MTMRLLKITKFIGNVFSSHPYQFREAKLISRGFSLLEVFIASTLVAAAGGLLFGSLFQASRSQQLRQEQAMGLQLLANRLALLEEVAPGEQSTGSFEEPLGKYAWHQKSTETSFAEVSQVHLDITWNNKTLDLVTYRPKPKSDE